VFLGWGRRGGQQVQRHLEGRLARVPVEVGVVEQGGELVDAFSDSLFRPKLAQEGDNVSQHQKSIAISRIVAPLLERTAYLGKNLLGGRAKHEIEGSETHAEI
jgi:hypothetical protein